MDTISVGVDMGLEVENPQDTGDPPRKRQARQHQTGPEQACEPWAASSPDQGGSRLTQSSRTPTPMLRKVLLAKTPGGMC